MKTLKKIGLISMLAAALLAGPMPGIKAKSYNKCLENTVSSAFAADYALQWPLDDFVVTQRFGENKNTHYGPQGHLSLDMTSSFGAPVKAAANGIIVAKGSNECPNFEQPECNYRLGNWIMLWHPDLKIHTVYSHLKEKPYKDIGSNIWQGETIGYEGGSGFQFYISSDNTKPVTNDTNCHHLDFMVGEFKVYKTFEGKTDFQIIKIYDPLKFLPPINKGEQ